MPWLWLLKWLIFHFFVFSADDSKKSVKVPLKYFNESGRCYLVLLENAMDYCSTISKMSTLENTGFRFFFFFCWLSSFFYISTLDISRTVTPKPINHTFFLQEFNKIFQKDLNILPKLTLMFAVISRKYKKWAIFNILMTITLRENMLTWQMILFFSSTLWALSVSIFHFCIWRPSKFNSMGSPLCIMFWSVKYTFTCRRWHFQAC